MPAAPAYDPELDTPAQNPALDTPGAQVEASAVGAEAGAVGGDEGGAVGGEQMPQALNLRAESTRSPRKSPCKAADSDKASGATRVYPLPANGDNLPTHNIS